MSFKGVKQLGARITNDMKPKSKLAVDAAAIRELAELLTETGLTEIEVEQNGQRIRIARQFAAASFTRADAGIPVMSEPVPTDLSVPESRPARRESISGTPVTSPMVGTVYIAPEPGKPPFVKVGDAVKEGQTLLIVEAMKTMNPIVAPKAGTVSDICITDAQPVEFGQTLLIIS
jgi:acetyl-CoA carboxylase biotin carboxyl carrier protein